MELIKDTRPEQLVVEVLIRTQEHAAIERLEVYGYDLNNIEDIQWRNDVLSVVFHNGHAVHHPIHTIQQVYTA